MRSFRSRDPVPIGIAFIAVVLVAMYLSFNIGKISFVSGPTYNAAFSEAAGLRPGDKVRVGGVAVGQVSKVALHDKHVQVTFTISDGGVHLGMDTRASIQIFTLLGNKYLALEPKGAGKWPRGRELPLTQTTSPYDVEPAFQDLTRAAGEIDVDQLARAFDTLSATFKDSSPAVRGMLDGLSRLSQTIASRDEELHQLLQHASTFTGVLADRREQFVSLFGDGSALLAMIDARRQVISELLANTVALSQQLIGLVHDNEKTLTPLLQHLHGVTSLLDRNQDNLDQVIKGLYVFIRGEVDATGAGPWFDGTAINATNPFHAGLPLPKVQSTVPRTFGDLLGLAQAQAALAGRR
ncbi:MAG: phospholipid/cholesterol/gamma-HCH transport system substrate-binding protein [Actinomycetota bacterium]|nr:phospholipid/cholesterol/gamma-HCH transport system substrate-binding protein [Actinomycetota bacterium]